MSKPELLLMGEPFGALDEFTREALNDMVLRLWEEERKTVVFVTHSVAEAVFLSDRIVIMGSRPGRIMEIMDIDLPRPRPANIRTAPEFYRLVAEVRDIMGGEHAKSDACGHTGPGSPGGQVGRAHVGTPAHHA